MERYEISVNWVAILGVALIVLKLTGVIDWSWVWVLAPFWVSVALGFMIVALALAAVIIEEMQK